MKRFVANIADEEKEFFINRIDDKTLQITIDDQTSELNVVKAGPHQYSVMKDGESFDLGFFRQDHSWVAFLNGEELHFTLKDEKAVRREMAGQGLGQSSGKIVSPMPGKVVDIKVKIGDSVKVGQGLVIVEAMKMQNEFKTDIAGVVKQVFVSIGDSVESGAVMAVVSQE